MTSLLTSEHHLKWQLVEDRWRLLVIKPATSTWETSCGTLRRQFIWNVLNFYKHYNQDFCLNKLISVVVSEQVQKSSEMSGSLTVKVNILGLIYEPWETPVSNNCISEDFPLTTVICDHSKRPFIIYLWRSFAPCLRILWSMMIDLVEGFLII